MAPKKSKNRQSPSEVFERIPPDIEDEILEAYSELTSGDGLEYEDADEDFYLHQLVELFAKLSIPKCFTSDIMNCIEYYYDFIKSREVMLDPLNIRQSMTLSMIQAYTISSNVQEIKNIIDIVDIDKLLRNLNRLIKFRNGYKHIQESWKLVVSNSTGRQDVDFENYKLTLPDLKQIKTNLNLNTPQTNESFLIDMLGCCSHDSNGNVLTFDYTRNKTGPNVSIKDFAEILGNLGELD